MRRPIPRALLTVLMLVALCIALPALAQSPLGIGSAEPSIAPTGPFAEWLRYINGKQSAFFQLMRGALTGMRDDGGQAWTLVGLSFVYGIFHAAGPGHGKVVISSYMLANEVALRRGIVLSFISALLQAVSAIAVIGAAYLLLRGTTIGLTDATFFLELASYALIAIFGFWLLYRKLRPVLARAFAPALVPAGLGINGLFDGASADWRSDQTLDGRTRDRGHTPGGHCAACGGLHAPDAQTLTGERFDLRAAWAAVLAVGIRPCSGALIVLSFALLNGLYAGGLLSVLAMALGTAITVSVLATLAVTAKDVALRLSGSGSLGGKVHFAIEIAGAVALVLIGLTLFAASIAA